MLTEIMEYLNNYFVPLAADRKSYTISGGVISPSFGAEEGDRFYICGSLRNDGVYTYKAAGIRNDDDSEAAGLRDETFAGTIRLCAVPPAVLRLSEEIKQWVATYGAQLASPMQSETFNGYSYTLKSGNGNNGGSLTWHDCPAAKNLERWRKPSVC